MSFFLPHSDQRIKLVLCVHCMCVCALKCVSLDQRVKWDYRVNQLDHICFSEESAIWPLFITLYSPFSSGQNSLHYSPDITVIISMVFFSARAIKLEQGDNIMTLSVLMQTTVKSFELVEANLQYWTVSLLTSILKHSVLMVYCFRVWLRVCPSST